MIKAAVFTGVVLSFTAVVAFRQPVKAAEQKAPPATMPIPTDYREWVYLTSGLDMTYTQAGGAGLPTDHKSVFDNVFVNPEAYRKFLRNGTWPDKTMFVLENRAGEGDVSINKAGKTQGAEVTGLEIHAKIDNQWAFYVRNKDGSEHLVPKPASCYTCHEEHAAVDTTFTQFYPTLLPVAKEKGVLSPKYLAEESARESSKGAQ